MAVYCSDSGAWKKSFTVVKKRTLIEKKIIEKNNFHLRLLPDSGDIFFLFFIKIPNYGFFTE